MALLARNWAFTISYVFAMETFTLPVSVPKLIFINNLLAFPIISMLISTIFSITSCTVRGGAYFAATDHNQGKYSCRQDFTQICMVFPTAYSSFTVLLHVCSLALFEWNVTRKSPWRAFTNSPRADFLFCVISLIYLFYYSNFLTIISHPL